MAIRPSVIQEELSDEGGVTIHDVAREAEVSIATVSRVLNGSSAVRDATRECAKSLKRETRAALTAASLAA